MLATSGTMDVVDAHVALLGRSLGAASLTSDPDDLEGLDVDLEIMSV